MRTLSSLGIVAERPIEAYDLGGTVSGFRRYGGWYHFMGTILREDPPEVNERVEVEPTHFVSLSDRYWIELTRTVHLVQTAFSGSPLIQMEFEALVPWVIKDEIPE